LRSTKRRASARHLIRIISLEALMRATRSFATRFALCATFAGGTALLFASAASARSPWFKGGPWISIETPANPYDTSARGASFVVHTFHHATPTDLVVEATAEGLVDGQRRTVPLTLKRASQTGAFPVRNVWGSKGTWSVLVKATQPAPKVSIQAVVDLGADGAVAGVSMPNRMLTAADIDGRLRERTGGRVAGR
jgi:hypothetical protein